VVCIGRSQKNEINRGGQQAHQPKEEQYESVTGNSLKGEKEPNVTGFSLLLIPTIRAAVMHEPKERKPTH
jgi:hypothetical protein